MSYPHQWPAPKRPAGLPGWAIAMIVLTGVLTLLIPVGLVVLYAYGYGKVHENMRFPGQDVTIASCDLEETTSRPVAAVRVTSQAGRKGSFTVTIGFTNPDGTPAGQALLVFKDVVPGQSVTQEARGPLQVTGTPACEETDTTFSSPPRSPTAQR